MPDRTHALFHLAYALPRVPTNGPYKHFPGVLINISRVVATNISVRGLHSECQGGEETESGADIILAEREGDVAIVASEPCRTQCVH